MHTMRLYEEIGIKNITGHTLSFDDYFINKIGVYIAKQSCQFECIFVRQYPAFNSAIDITGKSRTYPTLIGTIEISTTRLLLFLEASGFHILIVEIKKCCPTKQSKIQRPTCNDDGTHLETSGQHTNIGDPGPDIR